MRAQALTRRDMCTPWARAYLLLNLVQPTAASVPKQGSAAASLAPAAHEQPGMRTRQPPRLTTLSPFAHLLGPRQQPGAGERWETESPAGTGPSAFWATSTRARICHTLPTPTPRSLINIAVNGDVSSTLGAVQVTVGTQVDSVDTFIWKVRDSGQYYTTATGRDSSFAISVTE